MAIGLTCPTCGEHYQAGDVLKRWCCVRAHEAQAEGRRQ